MTAPPFDTLKLARKLEASGFTQQQAAGAAEAVAESMSEVQGLAAKADIKEALLRLESKIEAAKTETLRWMFGSLAAQGAMIAALIKLIH